ncbi:MAG: helix-turn-helix domain-containing protein [Frankiaceae bacterium]
MVSLLYDKAPPLVDEDALAALLADLSQASLELASSESVPGDVRALVRTLPERLHADAPMNALAGDPYQAENAFAGAARAAAALLGSDEREMRRDTRLALEQVRQALRDIMEARPVDEDAEPAQVAVWLEENLGLSQQQLAELVGSSTRTWQRWLAGTQPDPEQLVRLRRIARLAMHLRHALTGPGVARWFVRPHPLLKGGAGRPIDLLDDPEGYQKLLVLASGLRSTQAS